MNDKLVIYLATYVYIFLYRKWISMKQLTLD